MITEQQARLMEYANVRLWHAGRRFVSGCIFEELVRDGAGGKMGRVFLTQESYKKTVSLKQLYFTKEDAEADLAFRVMEDEITGEMTMPGIPHAPGSEGIFS